MPVSLYDLSVINYLQTLGGVEGFLNRGLAYCKEKNIDLNEVVETRLCEDMLPFKFQLHAVVHFSLGAIRGAKASLFQSPGPVPALDYAGFQKAVSEAREALEQVKPDEVNSLEGKEVQVGDRKLPFTVEGFLLSFSLPNFYFHATTAYTILRTKGVVPLGKRDYLGRLRSKS